MDAFLGELAASKGADARYDALVDSLSVQLRTPADPVQMQRHARVMVDQMATALQASVLLPSRRKEVSVYTTYWKLGWEPSSATITICYHVCCLRFLEPMIQ